MLRADHKKFCQMNACLLFRRLFIGMLFLPYMSNAQNPQALPVAYSPGGDGSGVTSNVPLNEINIRAFRHFRKRWPAVEAEVWLKEDRGYIVTFKEDSLHCQAHFDERGGFLYSLRYYAGDHISNDLSGLIQRTFPGYGIDVVTEITDGMKTFYLVKIGNPSAVKTLSVSEGKVEVFEDLVNGGRSTKPAGEFR
jgi:hypothetical protein